MGRETLARVQARWAARAGIEETIAVLEYHVENPVADDALAVVRDMEAVADGSLVSGTWTIRHTEDGVEVPGPQDESAKANINRVQRAQFLEIPNMTFDVADSIIDWRDADNEVSGMGAERDFYVNRNMPYQPRNANFRSLPELELVAGAWPEYVRGEDANLNGRLDPNENDGQLSPPDDNADGLLEAGWSGRLTAYTTVNMTGSSGKPKLYLKQTSSERLTAAFGVDESQAQALLTYFQQPNATLEALLVSDLSSLNQPSRGGSSGSRGRSGRSSSGAGGQPNQATVLPLSDDQLRLIFSEGTLDDPLKPGAGKVNLNTAPREVLQDVLNIDPYVVDYILNYRAAHNEGFSSIIDLKQSSKISSQTLAALARDLDTTSQVFSITSRGRAQATGLEVEMTVIVDRSTLPARILEYREQ
ncbi:MAG: general secretion pathway protein GspK [Phycisphaerae bacterium]|nr:general secretion pathway protein GspK [Phycisphaerae bacterium]